MMVEGYLQKESATPIGFLLLVLSLGLGGAAEKNVSRKSSKDCLVLASFLDLLWVFEGGEKEWLSLVPGNSSEQQLAKEPSHSHCR